MINYIVEGICLLLCVLHLIHTLLSGRKLSKKLDNVCLLCGAPVSKNEIHKCDLNSEQLDALYNFVISLKSVGGSDNVS